MSQVRLIGKQFFGEAIHSSLRKHTEYHQSIVVYNIISAMSSTTWNRYLDVIWENMIPDSPDQMGKQLRVTFDLILEQYPNDEDAQLLKRAVDQIPDSDMVTVASSLIDFA